MDTHAWSAEIFTKRWEKNSTIVMEKINFVMGAQDIEATCPRPTILHAILKNSGSKTEEFYLCLSTLYYFLLLYL